jgi:ABC-type glycerol-3-phosphate transport system substrate-binding protein
MKNLLTLLFITSILISACGGVSTPGAEEPSATESVEKTPAVAPAVETASRLNVEKEALNGLEITVWTPWYDVEQSLFESFVRQFNEENEWGIVVNVQSQVTFAGLYESTTASLPRSEKPDLVIALPEHAQGWYADGVVTDLAEYVNDPLYGMDASDIPDVFWNQDMAGDARVGVPAQRTAQFLLWNETWAQELGFDSAPQTTEEFREQACGANGSLLTDDSAQNDALGGWLVDTEPMTAYSWMLAFDGGVLEEGNYRFLAPNNVNAFKYLRTLSEENCSWQGAAEGPFTPFTERKALFITVGLGDLPAAARAFANASSADKWTVIPFPSEDGGVLAVYGSSYVVMKTTDAEQLAAWLFVRWLLEKEQDARWVEVTHLFPLRTSTVDLLGEYEKTRPQWKQAVELISFGEVQPQLGSWRTVKVMLGDGFRHMYRVNISSGQVPAILAQMDLMAKDVSE